MRVAGSVLIFTALASWTVAGWSEANEARRMVLTTIPYGVGSPDFQHLSSASCAAAACHGNGKIGGAGGEYSTWAALSRDGSGDPHSQAYRVLFNQVSQRISERLGLAAAHKEPLCLRCHAQPEVKPSQAISEGVGCGACHGPAEKWRSVHYLPAWKALSDREKWEQHGFVPTKNTTIRTLLCLGCHVGDSTREVNHDLIAAGHPRLVFESTRFHFNPKYRTHWVERTPQPDFEVRAWVIGQAATLRAATDLLRVRAERAATTAPGACWPELSGYSCYSCHQAIGSGSKHPDEESGPGGGHPRWESWSTAAVEVAAAYTSRVFPGCPPPALTAVRELQKLMETPKPKPELVQAKAAAAVAQLDAWLAALQASEERLRTVRLALDLPGKLTRALADNVLTPDRRFLRTHDWDFLASAVLGCGAMSHAVGVAEPEPGMDAPIQGLFDLLHFPPPIHGKRIRSPAGFDRDRLQRVQQHFGNLSSAAKAPGGRE
jgi:hypothetical protein